MKAWYDAYTKMGGSLKFEHEKKRLLGDDGNRMNERYHKVKGKNVKNRGWRILNIESDMPFEIELL